MSAREITFLGTASQVPTRHRNHNGLFIRWDTLGILVDPGEGTQRQLLLAGIAATQITHILITHFHGDHCLGLAALSQRISLDKVPHPVEVIYPASGQVFFERLRYASIYKEQAQLVPVPLALPTGADGNPVVGPLLATEIAAAKVKIWARPLSHRVECFGYRIEEADGVRMLPDKLAELAVRGPDIKKLQQSGTIVVGGKTISIGEVSVPRLGQKLAVVMDSRPCAQAVELAVRQETGDRRIDALTGWRRERLADDRWAVRIDLGGHRYRAQVAVAHDAEPRLLTCHADEPQVPRRFLVGALDRLPDA